MTSSLARLYVLVIAVLVFFVSWAAIAAKPWRSATVDPRVVALQERRTQLRQEALRVRRLLAQRYAVYQRALRTRQQAIADANAAQVRASAAPPPVVSIPPLTITRTS
jgi:hypothetical protein